MRRLSLWVLATSLFVSGAARSARAEGNDLTGQRAPEIYVQEGVQGIAPGASLAAYRGQVVVLKFWFTRCPACRRSLPEFQSLYQRYSPRGVQFLAIAYDETSNVRSYLRSTGFTFPVAVDGGGVTATRYGVFTYPTTYVIGADGLVKAYDQLSGPLLERELEAARAAPRPNAGHRPLASFPRSNPASPAPGTPPAVGATPTSAPLAPPPAPPAPPVAAAPPVAPPAAPAAVPEATPAPAPTPALAPPAGLASLPTEPAVPAAPLPTDPTLPAFPEPSVPPIDVPAAAGPGLPPVAPAAPSAPAEPVAISPMTAPPRTAVPGPTETARVEPAPSTAPVTVEAAGPSRQGRVDSGSVAPSEPASGGQPASRASLVIPPDPTAPGSSTTVRAEPWAPVPTAPETAAPVAPVPVDPTPLPASPAPTPVSPTSLPVPFAAASDLIAGGDFPAVLRLVESYASAHPDAAAWAPADLAEARRLEDFVKTKYLEGHAAARARWEQGEIGPAIDAARALESAYRGTGLERSAATLVSWFEAHRPAASR